MKTYSQNAIGRKGTYNGTDNNVPNFNHHFNRFMSKTSRLAEYDIKNVHNACVLKNKKKEHTIQKAFRIK